MNEPFSSPFSVQLEYDLVFFDNQFVAATSDGLLSWDGSQVRPMNKIYSSLPPLEYWELVLSQDSSSLFLFSTSTYIMKLDRAGRVSRISLKDKNGNSVFAKSGAKLLNGYLFIPIKRGVLVYSGDGIFLGGINHPNDHSPFYPIGHSNGKYFFLDNKGVVVFENVEAPKVSYYPHKLQVKDKYKHKLEFFANNASLFFRIASNAPVYSFSFSSEVYRKVRQDSLLLKSRTNNGIFSSKNPKYGFLLEDESPFGRSEQFVEPITLTSYLGANGSSRYLIGGYFHERKGIPSSWKLLYSNDTCFIYKDATRVFLMGNVEQNKTLGFIEEKETEYNKGFLLGKLLVIPGPKWYVFPVRNSDNEVKQPTYTSLQDFSLGGSWSFDVSFPLEITLGQPKSVFQGKESLVVQFNDAFGYVFYQGDKINFLFFQATLPGLFYFTEENQNLTLTLQDENVLRSFCISKPEGRVLNSSIKPQEERKSINYRPLVQYYMNNGLTMSLELGNRLIVRREGEIMAAIQLPSGRKLLSTINHAGLYTRACFASKDFVLCVSPYKYPFFSYQPLNGSHFFQEAKAFWVKGDTMIFQTDAALHKVQLSSTLSLERLTAVSPMVRGIDEIHLTSSMLSLDFGDSLRFNAGLPFFFSTLTSEYIMEISGVTVRESKSGTFNLTGIPPGVHEVKVWSYLSDLRIESSPFVFWIKVNPPWYKSLVFRLSIIFTILLCSFLFIRYWLRMRERRMKQLNRYYELELIAYQKTLNPHFVFNSLNTVYSLINSGNNEKASKFLVNFAGLLRGFLENLQSELIGLNKELELVRSYHKLQEDRFPESVELIIEAKPTFAEMDQISIPAGLIQVFIENCFVHAFQQNKVGNEVRILISEFNTKRRSFLIEILDNGMGINASRLRNKQRSKRGGPRSQNFQKEASLGLKLIDERLRVLKLKHEISIEIGIFDRGVDNKNETGTRILIEITYGKRHL